MVIQTKSISTTEYRKKLNTLLTHYQQSKQQVRQEKQHLQEAQEKVEHLLQAQQIVQVVAEEVQRSAHRQIASLVTKCLQAVFGEDDAYQFRITFSRKRGRTEATLLFVRDERECDPLSASGGGVVDIAAFALRLACLVLTRPKRRRLLVLDEPFRMLSRNYTRRVGELLLQLSKELGIQMILVTHNQNFQVGKVIELE